jgi:AcrR family transcriptional regulator
MDPICIVERATAPDPFDPILGFKLAPATPKLLSECSAPYRRRAEILATTRRLLAQDGYERITLKAISDACSITTQTIHNSFGCKTELLTAAMNQHTLSIDAHALSRTQDPVVFLWLALAYCRSATERPEFVRQYMKAAFAPKLPLRDMLLRFGADLKLQILRNMVRRNLLRPFIDPHMAAEQIAYVNTFAMLEWTENGDLKQLYERMIHGNGSILLGILTPEAGKDIEAWLSGRFFAVEDASPLLNG